MIKLIHFSDTHFDRPFELIKPDDFAARYAELKSSFTEMMHYINENEINIALVAGDLFDTETLSSDTLSFIKNSFASCPECRFFVAPGDSDPYSDTSPYARISWPQNVHIFKSSVPEQVHIEELNCDIYGVAVNKSTTPVQPMDPPEPFSVNRTNILIIHSETDKKNEPVYPFAEKDLVQSDFDYIAMGHHHTPDSASRGGKYAYSGAFIGHSFEECGTRGALQIFIDSGEVTVKELKFSHHSYIKISVDISHVPHYGNIDAAIARLIDDKIGEVLGKRNKIESISVCAALTGEVSEQISYDTAIIAKLVENSASIIVKDEASVSPGSQILGAMKAALEQEASDRGCTELTERAMRFIVTELHNAARKE